MSEYKPEDLEARANQEAGLHSAVLLIGSGVEAEDDGTNAAMLRAGAQAMRDLEAAQERVKELEETIEVQLMLVRKQAKDEGLWFVAQTAPEAYLQRELRRLHGALEANAVAFGVKP